MVSIYTKNFKGISFKKWNNAHENDEVITEERILVEKFTDHYTNIFERSCGIRPTKLNLINSSLNDNESGIDATHVIFVITQVLQKSKVNLCLHNQMQSLHLQKPIPCCIFIEISWHQENLWNR